MSKILLYCKDTAGLHLGPGLPDSEKVINFVQHYAELDEDDELFAEKMSWIGTRGCPPITIVTEAERATNIAVAEALAAAKLEGQVLR